jgi:hypothetical protein
MPFVNQWERDIHFAKHGHEFGAANADEYERMADVFMSGALEPDAQQCFRPTRVDRLRFGFITRRLGVACTKPVYIRTFHVVMITFVTTHGGSKGYFRWQCGRIM